LDANSRQAGECIEWTGGYTRDGYGRISINGVRMGAHRQSYLVNVGQIPTGMFVCHHCDNKKCIRPDHLFLGTAADNTADAVSKGRLSHGSTHYYAALSETDVQEIKRLYAEGRPKRGRGMSGTYSLSMLASIFGVAGTTISNVVNGYCWRHLQ
jgi:hypothetical protein